MNRNDPKAPASPPPRRITSTDLLGKQKRLIIEHRGQDYELRLTRQNKLILTK